MSFDLFADDPAPPSTEGVRESVTATAKRRRERRRLTFGAAGLLVAAAIAIPIVSASDEGRVVTDSSSGHFSERCSFSSLEISHAGVGVAAGHWGDRLLFRNVGSTSCSLNGYPTVIGVQSGFPIREEPIRPTQSGYIGYQTKDGSGPVELRPGESASAILEGTNAPAETGGIDPGSEGCSVYSGMRVGVPGDPGLKSLRSFWPGCGPPAVHPFTSIDAPSRPLTTTTARPALGTGPIARLNGKQFLVVVMKDNGVELPIVGQMDLRFNMNRLNDPDVFWTSGCNFFRAPVTITDSQLVVGDEIENISQTNGFAREVCPHPQLDDEEKWIENLLRADPTWTLQDGKLTLEAGDREAIGEEL